MSDGELRQTMKRLMSIHDEIDEKKLDLKTVYADAKSAGFDKTALGLAIRQIRSREKNETPAAQERSAIVELYVSTFDNAPRTYVHVRTREAGSEPMPHREHAAATQDGHDVDRGASAQPHSAEGGPAIPSKAGDAGTGQASATDTTGQPSGAGTGSAVRTGAPVSDTDYQPARLSAERDPQSVQHGSDSEGGAGGESPHSTTGSEQGSAAEPQARNEPGSAAAASGGEGLQSLPETPSAPAQVIGRKQVPLRPHCRRPELCGGYGSKHCGECERAAKAGEDDEASAIPAFVRKTRDHAIGEQA